MSCLQTTILIRTGLCLLKISGATFLPMMKSSALQTWINRLILIGFLLGMVLLNIKVLSNKSQSDNDSNQLLSSLNSNEKKVLKQPPSKPNESTMYTSANTARSRDGATLKVYVSLEPPISQPRYCRQAHCKEYLQKFELLAMNECSAETSKRTVNGKIQNENESKYNLKENNCSFINGSYRLPVALASTSGSGNTWIRGLLEQATGICTGFLYCDFAMRREGFIGESVKSGSVLVVKTHTITPKWYGTRQPYMDDPYYGSAIYILRNPYKSMIAEWNRRVTYDILKLPHSESHTNVIQEKFWRTPEWDEFLQSYMGRWKARLKNWVLDSHKQAVHVVRYEDLQRDVAGEVAKMLTFLKIPFNKEELPIRLDGDFTKFKRKHTNDNFEHFSSNQTEFIRRALVDTIKLARLANKSHILQIEDYLP